MAYLDGSRSTFPIEVDKIKELYDLSPRQLQSAKRLQELKIKQDRTPEEEQELNNLVVELQDFMPTAEDWNRAFDMSIATQKHYRDNTIGHVNQLKQETTDYVDVKKTEILDYTDSKQNEINTIVQDAKTTINTTVTNGQNSINTTKDNALISIENKKDNIIEYMDGTTAGALRNDIGVMGDLATTDKTSLVNAINEVNAKEVDLTPVENQLGELNGVKISVGTIIPTDTVFWLDTSED